MIMSWDPIGDWYDSPSANEYDYNIKQFVRALPVIGGFFQSRDSTRKMRDYLKNRGLSWSDVRYNGSFGTSVGGAVANGLNSSFGANILDLYRPIR